MPVLAPPLGDPQLPEVSQPLLEAVDCGAVGTSVLAAKTTRPANAPDAQVQVAFFIRC